MSMSPSFQIRETLSPKFNLFNYADAACTNCATLRCTTLKYLKSVFLWVN